MTIINSVIKGKQPVIDTLNVTPTTSAQQITAPQGTDGYSPVNVSAVTSSIDANIVAGNIKKDVQILGVTGSYEGTTPAYYIEKTKDANGKLQNSTNIIDLNGATDVGVYVLSCAYLGVSFPANTSIDLSSLTTVSGDRACAQMFEGCTGLTSVDLSGLTILSGNYACGYMFINCTGLTSVDLSGLTTLSGSYACAQMFNGCTGLTSVDLSGLTTLSGNYACSQMFYGCVGLTSVNLSGLTTLRGSNACANMFNGCTGLTSIALSGLTTVDGISGCQRMFYGCTSLATVYIGGTTAIDFGTNTNQFNNMFQSCAQNIDVYAPAANKTQIEAFPGYPNFSGTGTVTWHWRS